MKAKALIGLALASFVGACSTAYVDGDYWARPGLTQAQLDFDGNDCAAQVLAAAEAAERHVGGGQKSEMFQACMNDKGYELRNFTPDQRRVMADLRPDMSAKYVEALQADAKLSRTLIFIPAAPESQLP